MRRKAIVVAGILILAGAALFVCTSPRGVKGPVTVTFLAVTNDGTGSKIARFSATNGTGRLFVRGRSELEVQGSLSNQTTVVQLTSVDYLTSKQEKLFSFPCDSSGEPWRLRFTYIAPLSRWESFEYEAGWFMHRRGISVRLDRLPRNDVREITTEWIKD